MDDLSALEFEPSAVCLGEVTCPNVPIVRYVCTECGNTGILCRGHYDLIRAYVRPGCAVCSQVGTLAWTRVSEHSHG